MASTNMVAFEMEGSVRSEISIREGESSELDDLLIVGSWGKGGINDETQVSRPSS